MLLTRTTTHHYTYALAEWTAAAGSINRELKKHTAHCTLHTAHDCTAWLELKNIARIPDDMQNLRSDLEILKNASGIFSCPFIFNDDGGKGSSPFIVAME